MVFLAATIAYADERKQTVNQTMSDTVVVVSADTAYLVEPPTVIQPEELAWKPDPYKAVWMAAILPGYGQIYNRSYWKLPIVYGGFMGCGFAISWNNERYEAYKEAYRDILMDADHLSSDPTRSYNAILPEGYTIERMGGQNNYTAILKDRQNTYRRYRDISIVVAIAVYALSIIDAYVDAQLFDFDISDDLTLNVEPQLHFDEQNRRSAELKLAITF